MVDRVGCRVDICASQKRVRLTYQEPFNEKILMRASEQIRIEEQLKERLEAPVKKGALAGEISFWLGDARLKTCLLCVDESVERRNFEWCLKVLLRRFFVDVRINDVIE